MLRELYDHFKEESETFRFNKITTNNTIADDIDNIDNKEYIPVLKTIFSSEVNITDLYLQVCKRSNYPKLLTWILSVIVTTIFAVYMFNFFTSFGDKKDDKRKRKMMNRYAQGHQDVDSVEESKDLGNSLNPRDIFITKVKQTQTKMLTQSELDAFVIELRNPGIMVNLYHGGQKQKQMAAPKQKILRLNKDGFFYWSKESPVELLSNFIPSTNKSLRSWPATSIQHVYQYNNENDPDVINSFILQLKGDKMIHLSTNEPLSSQRMVTAFKSLISKLKEDPMFVNNVYVDVIQKGRFTLDSAAERED